LTLISSTDHDSRVLAKELKDQLARNRVRLSRHFEIDDQYRNYSDLVGRVMSGQPEVVIVVAGPLESAYLVSYLRSNGFDGCIYGGPSIGRTEFLRKAGPAAQGVTFPLLVEVLEKGSFAESYQTKYGAPPDFRALQTYDAVSLLIRAIRKAGLNRVLIRDAVRELSPWKGVSGPIIWDALGQNNRPVRLATVTGSQIETLQLR
jgi:branched-chain amino acid transport system substrate-binding protein